MSRPRNALDDRRERVLLVGSLPPPENGMTLSMRALLESALVRRFEVVHLDTSDHRGIENVGQIDLRNIKLALLHGAKFSWFLLRYRPAVVYLPIARNRVGFLRDALFLLPARLARRLVIVHFHSWDFDEFRRRERPWMRGLIRMSFGRRTHGIVLADTLRRAFGPLVGPERIHVVPNGVSDPGPGLPAGERQPNVLHLSTLWSEKGVFDVLELARRTRSTQPDARWILAGPWYDDTERSRAETFIRSERLEDRVVLTGAVRGQRKDDLLREAALLVIPSRWEGQPLVLLEALATGTPVVANRVGAIPDTMRDGVEGFVVDVGDVDALEDRVSRLLDEPALRTKLGLAARRKYELDYTAEHFGQRVTELLSIAARGYRPAVSALESKSRTAGG